MITKSFCWKRRKNSNLYTIINLTIQKICWSSCCLVQQKSWSRMDKNWEFSIATLKEQHKGFCKHFCSSIVNKKHSKNLIICIMSIIKTLMARSTTTKEWFCYWVQGIRENNSNKWTTNLARGGPISINFNK